jgi:hypothetical protein
VTAPDGRPLPGAPDVDGARKRFPAAEITEQKPGYEAVLPDQRRLAAMTIEGLESKLRTAMRK